MSALNYFYTYFSSPKLICLYLDAIYIFVSTYLYFKASASECRNDMFIDIHDIMCGSECMYMFFGTMYKLNQTRPAR